MGELVGSRDEGGIRRHTTWSVVASHLTGILKVDGGFQGLCNSDCKRSRVGVSNVGNINLRKWERDRRGVANKEQG